MMSDKPLKQLAFCFDGDPFELVPDHVAFNPPSAGRRSGVRRGKDLPAGASDIDKQKASIIAGILGKEEDLT